MPQTMKVVHLEVPVYFEDIAYSSNLVSFIDVFVTKQFY